MGTQNLTKQFSNLKTGDSRDINILLLGETGVGKSTFINSLANYLYYQDFKKAEQAEPIVLIPSVITIRDSNFEQKTIKIGKTDNNQRKEIGESATEDIKTYVLPVGEGKLRLRLIDTPGIGDARGPAQDDLNCENILSYLSYLQDLNAICCLLKSTDTRISVALEHSLKQILSHLEKSASKSLIFVFTNTRPTDYTGGDTLQRLQLMTDKMQETIPSIKIPLKNNVFCLDNEAFRFLIAVQHNMKIGGKQRNYFMESWNKSIKECWNLIYYIIGDLSQEPLKPLQIKNSVCINEARRLILQIYKPLVEISDLIIRNIRVMEFHQKELTNQYIMDAKKKLYIPVLNMEIIKLSHPATVCTSVTCKTNHQACHNPCYLKHIQKDIIGDPALLGCHLFKNKICEKCECNFSVHMHVYFYTRLVADKIMMNSSIPSNINDENEIREYVETLKMQIEDRKNEFKKECDVIMKSLAKFSFFMKNNTFTVFEDPFQKFINYLIERNKSFGIYQFEEFSQLLNQYEQEKMALKNILSMPSKSKDNILSIDMKPAEIMKCVSLLYLLKYNGRKIYELVKTQRTARLAEYTNLCEYVNPDISTPLEIRKKKLVDKNKTSNESKKKLNFDDIINKETDNKPSEEIWKKSFDQTEHPPAYNEIDQAHSLSFLPFQNDYTHSRLQPRFSGHDLKPPPRNFNHTQSLDHSFADASNRRLERHNHNGYKNNVCRNYSFPGYSSPYSPRYVENFEPREPLLLIRPSTWQRPDNRPVSNYPTYGVSSLPDIDYNPVRNDYVHSPVTWHGNVRYCMERNEDFWIGGRYQQHNTVDSSFSQHNHNNALPAPYYYTYSSLPARPLYRRSQTEYCERHNIDRSVCKCSDYN